MNQASQTSPHVLVVDDDLRLLDVLSRFLTGQGLMVSTAPNAQTARQLMGGVYFDAVVLDIMMPGETGLEFTRWIRAQQQALAQVPILLLSAKSEIEDRIHGLDMGADDYLPKPFEPRELMARLKSLFRRGGYEEVAASEPMLELVFGDFQFDLEVGILSCRGEAIKIPPIQVHLLRSLAQRPGEAVSRDELAASAPVPSSSRSIDVQIGRLRNQIEADPKVPRFVQTVRGTGYRLVLARS